MYFYSELGVKMFRQMLCGIDRTVLSSRTSETNHQIGESSIHISFYRGVYDMVDMLEEVRDLPVILQELDHWLIQTGEMVVTLVFTGVIYRTAIEYESTSVPARVVRDSFFIGEAHDFYFQHMFLDIIRELFQPGKLTKDGA